jgi:hypothetical protein
MTLSAGLAWDAFSRTVSSGTPASLTRLRANAFSVVGTIEIVPGLVCGLTAGLSLSDPNGLVFERLPITIDYEAGAIQGLVFGVGLEAKLAALGRFEIEGAGRFVYSLGSAKTRPMTGFAVPGTVTAKPTWFEASFGPRLSYRGWRGLVPYLRLSADWIRGRLTADEALSDLTGRQKIAFKAKGVFQAAMGADVALASRFTIRAEMGFVPYPGGTDVAASAGLFYRF